MKTATTVAQMLVRFCGVLLIALGILFWTSNALNLIPLHMLLGLILVLSLWTLAVIGARSGVAPGFVVVVLLWGLLVIVFGATQDRILNGTGDPHWIIKVLHLLVGLAAIGQAEGMGARIRERRAAVTA
jgi:hypothetical protein